MATETATLPQNLFTTTTDGFPYPVEPWQDAPTLVPPGVGGALRQAIEEDRAEPDWRQLERQRMVQAQVGACLGNEPMNESNRTCTRNSHYFACRHEIHCSCGRTSRVPDQGSGF